MTTPWESTPRRGTFGFDSSVLLELPFTTGTYVLEGEYLALFASPEAADSKVGPILFRHHVQQSSGAEILSRVYVIDPSSTHLGLWVFP